VDNIDVFESVFKRAERDPFQYNVTAPGKILLVTDLEGDPLARYEARVRGFLSGVGGDPAWTTLAKGDFGRWQELGERIEAEQPDLIVTYRLLRETHEALKFSLGAYLDTLTQAVEAPVLVLPHPDSSPAKDPLANRDSVMVVTDHLSGAHDLVNDAIVLTEPGGRLILCHLEDEDAFERVMAAVGKIPEIDTETVRETLRDQLLAGPRQYIASVAAVLKERRPRLRVGSVVEMSRVLDRYRTLLSEYEADLLVFSSKDDSQLAMHSLGHSLAVEFKDIPLLLR